MTSLRIHLLWAGMLCFGLLATQGAWAQTVRERAAALSLEASAAYAGEAWEDAITLLEEAFLLVPDPAFAYNLASLYEAQGEAGLAWMFSLRYLELYPGADDADEVRTRIASFEEELTAGWTRLELDSEPSEAEVMLHPDDGSPPRRLGVTPLEGWARPGSHVLRLTHLGHPPLEDRFQAVPGVVVVRRFTFEVPPVAAPPVPAPPPGAAPVPDPGPVARSAAETLPPGQGVIPHGHSATHQTGSPALRPGW
jgi:hypothetical protein